MDKRSLLPLKLKAFKCYLDGTVQERRSALTVLSIFRIISSTNNFIDYSQIEAPRSIDRDFSSLDVNNDKSYLSRVVEKNPSSINKKLLRSWRHCVNKMFPPDKLSYRNTLLQGNNLHISNRNGPNGHVLTSIALDWLSIQSQDIINNIIGIGQLTRNEHLMQVIATFYNTDVKVHSGNINDLVSSRLSLKQEAGGKNRLFAIGDYFTQSALKSLHNYLFGFLRRFPEDGTHSHNYVSQICKEWSANPENRIYSVDLTGATNFIDCEVLGEIVSSISGEEYAKHWVNLMVNRDFKDINGELKRYTVGQPMGFYSSWAMLAIWNHLMVRTCRHALGLHPQEDDPQFVIIGDDVSILGDDVAQMYLHLCKLMGVPISPLKGFSPLTKVKEPNLIDNNSTMNAVEIAKRVFIDGLELSPISPVEITSGLESNYNFPALLLSMVERGITTFDYENVNTLAHRTPNYRTSLDVSLFPMSPSLNWVTVTERNMISIFRDEESFWNGKPYPLISQLFYIYIKQRIKRSVEAFEKALMPIVSLTPETQFKSRAFAFSSTAHYLCLQYIAHTANEMSKRICSRISLVGDKSSQLDNSLEAQAEKSRVVRKEIGLINAIFELESIVINYDSNRFEDKQLKTDRLITEVVKDIKAMFG